MKKSLSKLKMESTSEPVVMVPLDQVVKTFRKFGYAMDYQGRFITVLRNSEFPFQRVTLPDRPALSHFLIRLYVNDLGIDVNLFYSELNR